MTGGTHTHTALPEGSMVGMPMQGPQPCKGLRGCQTAVGLQSDEFTNDSAEKFVHSGGHSRHLLLSFGKGSVFWLSAGL